MAINKKLISFDSQSQFDSKLNAGEIDNRSIVFIEDTKRIWTHGVFFDTSWNYVGGKPTTFAPSAHTLDSHSNVTISSNTAGEILKWNGSNWINNTLAEAGIAAASHTHDYLPLTGGTITGTIIANNPITAAVIQKTSSSGLAILRMLSTGSSYDKGFGLSMYGDLIFGDWSTVSSLSSTWNKIYHTGNLTLATQSITGLMSATDKAKLDGIGDYKDYGIGRTTANIYTGNDANVPIETGLYSTLASNTLNTPIFGSSGSLIMLQSGASGNTYKSQIWVKGNANTNNQIFFRHKKGSGDWNAWDELYHTGNLINPVTGTGTANYLPKFTGASSIGNSAIYESGGNIGIGTSSPGAKLEVNGKGIFTDDLTIDTYAKIYGASNTAVYYNAVNNGNTVLAGGNSTADGANISLGGSAGNNDLRIRIGTSEKFRIDSTGNVGINTTSPTEKLHVIGNAIISGTVTAPTFSGNLNGNASTVSLTADNSTNATRYLLFSDATTGNKSPRTDTGLTYNPSTNTLTATTFNGSADLLDGLHKTAFSQEFHYGTTAIQSGYYKINILPTTSWMLSFTIRVYQGYNCFDITISGYNYGTNHWHAPKAILSNSSYNTVEVQFGYDSDWNLWVAIPVSSYTGLTILNINNGHTQVADWSDKFTITRQDTLTGTVQTTITAKRPLNYDENAVSATKLQTARTINGVAFDGSANITITAATPATLTRGSYLTGNNFNGSAATTWAVDATSANTANKVVARDSSGNFSAGTITANLSGNASSASKVNQSLILKFDTGTTEGTNLYTFNGSAAKTIDIKAGSNITLTKATNTVTINSATYVHPTGDGYLHVPATGTTNNNKVLKAGSTAGSISWGNVAFSEIISKPTTLSGYGITDATPSSHIGATGSAHGVVTTSVNGFMSAADKSKLDGIQSGANYYVHPTGDGYLHVPATGTTNNGKVLKAGSTAGSISWGTLADIGAVTTNTTQTITGAKTFSSAITASSTITATNFVSTATSGFMFTGAKATIYNAFGAPTGGGFTFVPNGGALAEANVALTIAANKNVGIGTISPAYKLDVSGSSKFSGDMDITLDLRVGGEVLANGFVQNSDIRLKNVIAPLKINIKDILNIPSFYFTYKDKDKERINIGTSAQEVQKVFPELVNEDSNTGILSIQYDKLGLIALEIIKLQQEEINELRNEISLLASNIKQHGSRH